MKFLGALNTLPDIVFTWHDKSFLSHLQSTLVGQGYPEDFSLDDEDMKLNVISQFFSPLIASQKYMTNIGDPLSTITCENGSIVAIQNYDNLFYIALCGDGEESEWFLHKKIAAFRYLVGMLYGSASEQLKPSLTNVRQQRWKALGNLLETWQILSQQEQMFLVESLERLHVNPMLNTVCLNLLEDVLSKANKEGHAVHSLLLVNNKLLGLYSIQNAPELRTSDILMLTVFLKEKFRYEDRTVPFSVHRAPLQLQSIKTVESDTSTCFLERENQNSFPIDLVETPKDEKTKQTNDSPSSCVEYLSANSTPLMNPMLSVQEGYHTPHGGSPTLLEGLQQSDGHLENEVTTQDDDESSSFSQTPCEDPKETESKEDSVERNEVETFQLSLFLKTAECSYTPHTIDFIKLDSATVLITISESRLVNFSLILSHIIDMLTHFTQKGQHSSYLETYSGAKVYEKTDNLFKKLVDGIYSNHELQFKWLIDNVVLLKNQWETVKQNGLKAHLESAEQELTPKLEASVTAVKQTTKAIFTFIFINQRPPKQGRVERHLRVISNIREIAASKLSYFSSYLQVRGQRNVTMTAYNNDFPGLVHFIYINRTTNQLTAPTINQQSQSSMHSIQHLIKQKVWEMWQYAENHVTKGYASFIIKHSDLTYSYFLWFEDAMGKPLSVQKLPKVDHGKNLTGIFSSNFYNDLIRQCFPTMSLDAVHCYELFCVHIGIVSSRFIATSCKKLANRLWETSGEASSPIGLL